MNINLVQHRAKGIHEDNNFVTRDQQFYFYKAMMRLMVQIYDQIVIQLQWTHG